jgi:DNA-directed RNA polymerase subunit M/transcription elongation factor TFIIS
VQPGAGEAEMSIETGSCMRCGEYKRVTVSVQQREDKPPLWRYHCKACGLAWTAEENAKVN